MALLDGDGVVSDSLRVVKFYAKQTAKVEKVVFSDGTEWIQMIYNRCHFLRDGEA